MSRCWVMGYFDSTKEFQRHSESSETSKPSYYSLCNHSLPTMSAQNLQTPELINTKNFKNQKMSVPLAHKMY